MAELYPKIIAGNGLLLGIRIIVLPPCITNNMFTQQILDPLNQTRKSASPRSGNA